jgi:TolB-like protein/DNA-binding winged helix-turn-helix (wHTH) protein/cytochrome c-type biogenesis protein CcmH/NrfG
VGKGILQFGEFTLDCDRFELRRAGRTLKLERKPMDLLILLVTREAELVTREEIAERLWGEDVFVDTEHGINTAIRKVRYVLRDDPEQPRFVQTVMGKGYRFLGATEELRLQGVEVPRLPVAANGNGRGDATAISPLDETLASAESPDELRPRSRVRSGFRAAGAFAGAVFLIAAAMIGVRVLRGRELRGAQAEIHSLAVLPLDNLSGNPGQEYFADGMTDELTTMLAKDSTLRVVSRTSAMQYKGVHRPLREIAQALGVDGVVEGSVERTGDKVHMTLQLIQGPSDTHVWAESYDRDGNDIVSLPDEAAMAIAKHTNSKVLQPAPARYVNPAAHDAYLHGKYLWYQGPNEEAGKYLKKAVALQPDYAAAWAGVADYYAAGAVEGILDPRESLAPAEAAAQRAVDLDDSLPEAHNSLCAAFFFSQWDFARADRECLRAIALDPKFAESYHLRAKVLIAMHRDDEAIASQKEASELDPFSRPWALAYIYMLARQYDAALEEARQRLESDPHNATTLSMLAWIYRCKGMRAEAAKAWADGLVANGDQADAASIRRAFAQGGYRAVLLWDIGNMKKQSKSRYISPVDLAVHYAQLGEREEALNLLEEGYRQHSPQLVQDVQDEPAFDFLHSDERYRSLIKRIGLPPGD